ncbi:hypothetical protein [Faecalispora jeddahensis]|uniref:hypothetical protein n=1 Tax=Faecalispora jeddahensis TaxID=1414721 RepID=UPI0018971D00|nr:hypothetical protein [Faecalispora jeddahensis]
MESEEMREMLLSVKDFIIRASKEGARSEEVTVLPSVMESLAKLLESYFVNPN